MKHTLYLHIGSGKTGSSFIQKNLFLNKDMLKKHGYFYPSKGTSGDFSHNKLALLGMPHFNYTHNPDEVDSLLDEIETDFINSGCNSLILSSECFPYILRNKYDFLSYHKFFNNYDVNVICYLRDPADFFESRYKQYVKDPNIALQDSFDVFFDKNHSSCDFDWIYDIKDKNPDYKINVLNYDELKNDILNSFLLKLSLEKLKLDVVFDNVNSSIDAVNTELIRLKNIHKDKAEILKDIRLPDVSNTRYINDVQSKFLREKYSYKTLFRDFCD